MKPQGSISAAEYRRIVGAAPVGPAQPWSQAKPTDCRQGHRHASKAEAATCDRLTLECLATGATLYRQFRLPLTVLRLGKTGKPTYMTIDFAIQPKSVRFPIRFIDTKGRIAKGWNERAQAFRESYGVEIEEVSK